MEVIKVTDQAREQIKVMMEDETEGVLLRFGIQGGGCTGLSYTLGFEYEVNEALDTTFESNGIQVILTKMDIPMVENTVIDFKQNLMGGGFSIENPNATLSCGCGSSFRTKDHAGVPDEDC